jgi:peptide-N4-(N-acetyl-beta-glucosaminyl)asparagine amidase
MCLLYMMLSLLLSQLSDEHPSGDRTVHVMQLLKDFLLEIKSQPFKERKSFLNLKPFDISEEMKGVHWKIVRCSLHEGWMGWYWWGLPVALDLNPVSTSLALPVALDSVDEVINGYKNEVYRRNGITFLRPNLFLDRIDSAGMVIASGEQPPVGIVS